MALRGLLDWKVIVALLAALLIAYVVFGGTGDVRSLIERGFGKASELSGGALPLPALGGSAVPARVLFTSDVALVPDRPVDLTIGDVRLYRFSGSLTVGNGTLRIRQKGTDFEIVAPIKDVSFADFSLGALSVSNADFTILPNVSAQNATLELKGFRGTVTVSEAGTLLDGNVTSLRTNIGGRAWELK